MRATDFAAIRPHLQGAIDDIDYYSNRLKEREKVDRDLCELYDFVVVGKTPPEVKGRGKPVQLTLEQQAALLHWQTPSGEPITAEQRDAILADLPPEEPMSGVQWAGLQFALRGGWRESSRQAAAWLRKAGEAVAADGIDMALSRLPGEPREAKELPGYRDTIREAAEYVKTILTTCLAGGQDPWGGKSGDLSAARFQADQDSTGNVQLDGSVEFSNETNRRGRLPKADGTALRNLWALQQWEASGTETYHKPTEVWRKWQAMAQGERAAICPASSGKVAKEAMISGIKRARKLRDGKPAMGHKAEQSRKPPEE